MRDGNLKDAINLLRGDYVESIASMLGALQPYQDKIEEINADADKKLDSEKRDYGSAVQALFSLREAQTASDSYVDEFVQRYNEKFQSDIVHQKNW